MVIDKFLKKKDARSRRDFSFADRWAETV